jgi:dihydropyrimidine dehydrogenase (NADP+)
MKKAFDEGWGAVICKTLSLVSSKVRNVTPRYARATGRSGEVLAWENIELISDRPFETMLADLKQLKEEYPDRCFSKQCMDTIYEQYVHFPCPKVRIGGSHLGLPSDLSI